MFEVEDEQHYQIIQLTNNLERAQILINDLLAQNEDLRNQNEVMKFHMNHMSKQLGQTAEELTSIRAERRQHCCDRDWKTF